MSAFSGKQGKGAMKKRREAKRIEALTRNGNPHTPIERRRWYRKSLGGAS